MSKLIALRSGYIDGWQIDFSSRLKQQALLFDQIGIFNLNEIMFDSIAALMDETRKEGGFLKSELTWLREKEIVFEPNIDSIKEEDLRTEIGESLFFRLIEKGEEYRKLAEKQERTHIPENFEEINIDEIDVDEFIEDFNDLSALFESRREIDSIILRLLSLSMEKTEKITAVTTLPLIEYTRQIPNSKKCDVMQIVINKLPLPDNMTPWEQIIDYRDDPENQKMLLALRRWIRKISAENLSPIEIEEELEWLINEFQNHMKLHKLKANTEILEVMVKAPLEIIEDLVKLKLSKIPESFFAIKKRQLSLMEAEINAPGKEMAYIIKSKETF